MVGIRTPVREPMSHSRVSPYRSWLTILTAVAMVSTFVVPAAGTVTLASTITVCQDGSCDFTSIQDAVDAADPGDTVFVQNGVYEESVLITTDGLTLRGESETGVVIDVSSFDDRRGITARPADNDGFNADKLEDLRIESLSVHGPTLLSSTSSKHFGIHIFDAANPVVEDVTVADSSRSELDIHAVEGGLIRDVTLAGQGTAGVGLAITDSHDVTAEKITTSANGWGGIAVFTSGSFAPGGTSDVTVTGHTSSSESPPLYEQTHGGHPITDLTLPQYEFVSEHPDFATFTFHFRDVDPALGFGADLNAAAGDKDAIVQNETSGIYHVGPGMGIQAAVDAVPAGGDAVVHPGTYEEQLVIDKSLQLTGRSGAEIRAPASLDADPDGRSHIVRITGTDVAATISGFNISGPGPSSCGSLHGGIAVKRGAKGVIRDNRISAIRDDPVSGCQNGVGVIVGRIWYGQGTSTATAQILGNTIEDFQKSAVVVAGNGSKADILDNQLTCSGNDVDDVIAQDAIQLWQSSSGQIARNKISLCRSTFNGAPRGVGIHLSDGVHDVRISENEIPGAQTAIALMNFAPWTNPADHARAEDIEIIGNEILGVDGAVYLAGSADGVLVRNNEITFADVLGVFVGPDTWLNSPPDFTDVEIVDNDLVNNDAPALFVRGSAGNVTAHLNTIANNDVGLLNLDDDPVDATHNWWGSPNGPNATSNPLPGPVPKGEDVVGPADVTPWCVSFTCSVNRPVHLLSPHPGLGS